MGSTAAPESDDEVSVCAAMEVAEPQNGAIGVLARSVASVGADVIRVSSPPAFASICVVSDAMEATAADCSAGGRPLVATGSVTGGRTALAFIPGGAGGAGMVTADASTIVERVEMRSAVTVVAEELAAIDVTAARTLDASATLSVALPAASDVVSELRAAAATDASVTESDGDADAIET